MDVTVGRNLASEKKFLAPQLNYRVESTNYLENEDKHYIGLAEVYLIPKNGGKIFIYYLNNHRKKYAKIRVFAEPYIPI